MKNLYVERRDYVCLFLLCIHYFQIVCKCVFLFSLCGPEKGRLCSACVGVMPDASATESLVSSVGIPTFHLVLTEPAVYQVMYNFSVMVVIVFRSMSFGPLCAFSIWVRLRALLDCEHGIMLCLSIHGGTVCVAFSRKSDGEGGCGDSSCGTFHPCRWCIAS